jgi:sugar/nucleoside kinase (ribokinase family)
MDKYVSLILGQVSLDINVDHTGRAVREVGGAVVASGFAASALGHKTCVLPKANLREVDLAALFARAANVDVIPLASPRCTSIENVYHTADKERRTCRAISRIEPYRLHEMPDVDASVVHIAGLMRGDFGGEIIQWASGRSLCALDVQCMLRRAEEPDGIMAFHDWPEKLKYLPLIHFLKTDAAEAEILTGLSDRREAAKMLHGWGAKEVMITHNTEAIVYDGERFCAQPLVPRNLSGRTGRGDTCFSAYITERLTRPTGEALLTAAALVSLKMETPGPFTGTRADVEAYIGAFYRG